MGKTFVEASTEIDDLISKKNEILIKIGNSVAAAIVDRANNNKINLLSGLSKDVNNLLKDLSDHERYIVMLHAACTIAKSKSAGGNKASNTQSSSRENLFSRFS